MEFIEETLEENEGTIFWHCVIHWPEIGAHKVAHTLEILQDENKENCCDALNLKSDWISFVGCLGNFLFFFFLSFFSPLKKALKSAKLCQIWMPSNDKFDILYLSERQGAESITIFFFFCLNHTQTLYKNTFLEETEKFQNCKNDESDCSFK